MTAGSRPSASADTHILPTGTVTFLFSDIEGSTKRWEQQRAAMPEALQRHDELLRTAVEAHGGYVFKTVGDAFCAAFARVSDAVAACVDAQDARSRQPVNEKAQRRNTARRFRSIQHLHGRGQRSKPCVSEMGGHTTKYRINAKTSFLLEKK
jgi:class 3 adenylate cyclase